MGEDYIESVKVGQGSPYRNCSDWSEILILEGFDPVGCSCLLYAPDQGADFSGFLNSSVLALVPGSEHTNDLTEEMIK